MRDVPAWQVSCEARAAPKPGNPGDDEGTQLLPPGSSESGRERAIIRLREQGETLEQIGERFAISAERVRTILLGAGAIDSGQAKHVRARVKQQKAWAHREVVLCGWREGEDLGVIAAQLNLPRWCVVSLIESCATSSDRAVRRLSHSARASKRRGRGSTDEQLIEAIRRVVDKGGHIPTGKEYAQIARTHGLPSVSTVANRFGGWNGALRAAGLADNTPARAARLPQWTKERCVWRLRELLNERATFPTIREYEELSQGRSDMPCCATLRKRFGSWPQVALSVIGEPRDTHNIEKRRHPSSLDLPLGHTGQAINKRTTHLIALVEDGATLEAAGRVYGIGSERVRQILKQEGVVAGKARHRNERYGRRALRPPPHRQLGPAVEALWRSGRRFREIAQLLSIPREVVRELICERVPRDERVMLIAERFGASKVAMDEILAALRDAADVLGRTPSRPAYERLRGQGLIEGPPAGEITHRLGWAPACELAGLRPVERPVPQRAAKNPQLERKGATERQVNLTWRSGYSRGVPH